MKKFSKKKELNIEKKDSSQLKKEYGEEVIRRTKKARRERIWKIIQRVVIGAVVSTVICSVSRGFFVSSKNYFKNSDLIPQVTSELCTDMDLMHCSRRNDQILRLKPNDDGNVCVYIADSVPQRTKQNIQTSLDYFNDVFDDINDRYNFQVGNMAEYLADKAVQKSTIKFDYKSLKDDVVGLNNHKQSLFDFPKKIFTDSKNAGVYCISSNISLNKDYFEKYDDKMQQYAIKHELMHSLGFDDTYNAKFNDFTTIMNVNNLYITHEVSPSDMRRLYTAYCEDYVNTDKTLNYEKLTEIKEYLNNYEKQYYDNVASVLKNVFSGKCYEISNEELSNFKASYGLLNVKINADGKYEYDYNMASRDINARASGGGDIIKGKDYAILPDVNTLGISKYYIVLKDEKGLNLYSVNVNILSQNQENLILKPCIRVVNYSYSTKNGDSIQK